MTEHLVFTAASFRLTPATARKRVEAGAAAHQEQLRAEVQSEQARSELIGFQLDLATVRQVLATIVGRPILHDDAVTGRVWPLPHGI